MENPHSPRHLPEALADLDDVRRLVGDIENGKALEILALHPVIVDLERAALWAAGSGDVLGKQDPPLLGTIAAIVEILTADEEEPPPAG
jgi:hypothetical protein